MEFSGVKLYREAVVIRLDGRARVAGAVPEVGTEERRRRGVKRTELIVSGRGTVTRLTTGQAREWARVMRRRFYRRHGLGGVSYSPTGSELYVPGSRVRDGAVVAVTPHRPFGASWRRFLRTYEGSIFERYRRRGPRGFVRGFSKSSKFRLQFKLLNAAVRFRQSITLTYHGIASGGHGWQVAESNAALVRRAKRDLNRWLTACRADIGAYVWVQEFQQRGAVHFHVLVEREADAKRLALLWHLAASQAVRVGPRQAARLREAGMKVVQLVHGGRVLRAHVLDVAAYRHGVHVRKLEDDRVARVYAFKYAGKESQKTVPAGVGRGGRFWGASRSLKLDVRIEAVSSRGDLEGSERTGYTAVRWVRRYLRAVARASGVRVRDCGAVMLWGSLAGKASAIEAIIRAALQTGKQWESGSECSSCS